MRSCTPSHRVIDPRLPTGIYHSQCRKPMGLRFVRLILMSCLTCLSPWNSIRAAEPKVADESFIASGGIVDAAGSPVANALILSEFDSLDSNRIYREQRSDRRGEFAIRYPATHSDRNLFLTWIYAEGHGLQAVYLKLAFADQEHVNGIEFRLREPSEITFRIQNPDGSPCTDATVLPYRVRLFDGRLLDGKFVIGQWPTSCPLPEQLEPVLGQRTGKNGSVRIANVANELFKQIEIRSPRYGIQRFWVDENTDTYQLSDAGEIRGRVLIDAPQQVAGTIVHVETSSSNRSQGIAVTRLDEQARFHVPAIAAGPHLRVTMDWDESVPVHPVNENRGIVNVVAGETSEVTYPTRPRVTVRGRVLTSDTGQPVVGGQVFLNTLNSPINGVRATTDNEGRFSIRIAPGTALQQVTSMGKDPSMYERYDYPRLDHLEIPDSVDEVNLEPYLLTARQLVRGRLTDAGGVPISAANVIFHSPRLPFPHGSAVTNQAGEFEMRVRDYKILRDHSFGNNRYDPNVEWAILESDKPVDGQRKRKTTKLRVVSEESDNVILERP